VNKSTIAILLFKNVSGNQKDEYFTDCIMEDILPQLSKISELPVISRTTMIQYKGTKKLLKEIGKEVNADVVREGKVSMSAMVIELLIYVRYALSMMEIVRKGNQKVKVIAPAVMMLFYQFQYRKMTDIIWNGILCIGISIAPRIFGMTLNRRSPSPSKYVRSRAIQERTVARTSALTLSKNLTD